MIEYFEKLVRDLKQLNQDIQNLLQFLASGLTKQDCTVQVFHGNDVAGLRKRLSRQNKKCKFRTCERIFFRA